MALRCKRPPTERHHNAMAMTDFRGRPARLVYLVTEDWYFVSHQLPMARAARDAGFDVHVITRVEQHGAAITAEGERKALL